MQVFKKLDGLVAALDQANIDTDQIIPKQYLKSIKRTGFGSNLFDDWRYLDAGEPGMDHSKRRLNPDFVLNQSRYQGAQVLLARENFGCGSSREHAPWALLEYGFSCIIAPSFADIFYSNCLKNGILAIKLDAIQVDKLFVQAHGQPGYRLTIDLPSQTIHTPAGNQIRFEIDSFAKQRLLNGLDDIAVSLQQADKIRAYEQERMKVTPWIFNNHLS